MNIVCVTQTNTEAFLPPQKKNTKQSEITSHNNGGRGERDTTDTTDAGTAHSLLKTKNKKTTKQGAGGEHARKALTEET